MSRPDAVQRAAQRRALAELEKLVAAAMALSEHWDEVLNPGYPARLPAFDEFVVELIDWQRAVHDAAREDEEVTP